MATRCYYPVSHQDISPAVTGSWQTADLSAFIPSGATGVALHISNAGASNRAVGWRKNGSTDNRLGDISTGGQCYAYVGVDASRICELQIAHADAVIRLVGYFTDPVVFFTNAVDKTPATKGSFQDVDISSDTGGDTAIAAIFEALLANNNTWGARKKGSTDNRTQNMRHLGVIVGVDGSEVCQINSDSLGGSATSFLIGYVKTGAAALFRTNALDRSLGSTGSYGDLTALPGGAVAGLYEVVNGSGGNQWSIREKGASEDYFLTANLRHTWAVVKCDASLLCEGKIGNTAADFFELGVFFDPVVASPGVGTLSLSGLAPAPQSQLKPSPPAGALQLSSFAPTATGDLPGPWVIGTRNVIAMVAKPFDETLSSSIQGPPWPSGNVEELYGDINDFSIAGAFTEVFASDVGYTSRPDDLPSDTWFPPALLSPFNFEFQMFDGLKPGGRSRIGIGDIVIGNEKGDRDAWLDLSWSHAEILLYRGKIGAPFSTFTLIFRGTSDRLEWTDRKITVRLRSREAPFDLPMLTRFYGGSGGLEGDTGATGAPVPEAYGYCQNIEPVRIDSANLVYQFGRGAAQAVLAVRDKGVPIPGGTDYATLAALLGATIPAGNHATCLAQSLIRLESQPDGVVTADVEGNSEGGFVQTTASIAARLAMTKLGTGSFQSSELVGFSALDAAQPARVGRYYADAAFTVGEAMDELLGSIGAAWWCGIDGKLNVARLEEPVASPSIVLTRSNIGAAGVTRIGGDPVALWRVGYDRIFRVQTADELAAPPGVSEANRARFGEALRWAIREDPSILYRFRGAVQVEVPTLFADQADAQTEAGRLLAMFDRERALWTVPVAGIDVFSLAAASVVSIQGWDRLTLDPAGTSFVLVGIAADVSRNDLTLLLWG